ncbi:MAG: dockerin type I repeat-containing protein, partial [Lachnospiraceae bacterium]
AGGTDAYNRGESATGKAYDEYLWVPPSVSPGELKGLVMIKMNLIEIPFVYSAKLKSALAEKDFGILFLVMQKDNMRYNTTVNNFNTRLDYKGETLYTETDEISGTPVFTTDGKDAADIMDEMLAGIAASSGYTEIADTTPLITIGHSASSPFGYRSGNWNPDRIIAQVQMKNGMGAPTYLSNKGIVPGIPSLQYAAQYTEHAMNTDRDRSVRDARWHINNQRAKDTNMLVSHIIEWGSGHYDWSDNATDMMIAYIEKAITYRLPDNYSEIKKLNDLAGNGYLAKPFEKDADNQERPAGYYRDTLKGWLTSGQAEASASDEDKKASFWFFDEEFERAVNDFTSYGIPESPDSKGTGVAGNTYSEKEPFMLMKDPSKSTYSDTPYTSSNLISPYLTYGGNSKYGGNRFINYRKMANPSGDASNSANLAGYGEVTVDTYYMNKVPAITTNSNSAYENEGADVAYPSDVRCPFIPLIAPYEYVSSELVDISTMQRDMENTDENIVRESNNVASVTRTTLRFHNNRVWYATGCGSLNEYAHTDGGTGFIYSPEVTDENGNVISTFKVTAAGMTIPYVQKGTAQTLALHTMDNICVKELTENPVIDVTYTSTDADLQKYTDVFVEYGPAKAIRTMDPEDGSYSWKVEVLLDQIPENAQYPIPINIVASNLGKWEKVYGATASQVVYLTEEEVRNGVYMDDAKVSEGYDTALNTAKADTSKEHEIVIYSDQTTAQRTELNSTEVITIKGSGEKATITNTSNGMMFLNKNGTTTQLNLGDKELSGTDAAKSLWFNANNKKLFAEVNTGSINLYHGAVISGGNNARGAGFDCKSGGTVNIYGGLMTGNTATGTSGGGAIAAIGSGVVNMSGGEITKNTSEGNYGGGVSVTENGQFHMSGGKIYDNTGYDVYVANNNCYLSGSAEAGNVYVVSDMQIQVDAAFTTNTTHATLIPQTYVEGTVLVTYAEGITPNTDDFAVAPDGETNYYLKAVGQNLVLTAVEPTVLKGDVNRDGRITAVDALLVLLESENAALDVADMNGDNKVDEQDAGLILQEATK